MHKFVNKNTGVVYVVNDPLIIKFFENNNAYEVFKEKKKKQEEK